MRHFVLTLLGLGLSAPAFGQAPVYYVPYPQPVYYYYAPPAYYAAPTYYPVQPAYYASPSAVEQTEVPVTTTAPAGENIFYGGVLTTDGVVPVRDYFTGLQRRSSFLQQMRDRQAPGRMLPPVLPPKLDEHTARSIAAEPVAPDPISVPVTATTPVAPSRGFLQRLFQPSLER